ncbi:hypothetical protein PMIT1320_01028 [Prochlorococcus marinus str. MIT 1320]|nr:hypothetical protein PMIT1320_01028 [Prochlorococcus marinus str. MIT 1320]
MDLTKIIFTQPSTTYLDTYDLFIDSIDFIVMPNK